MPPPLRELYLLYHELRPSETSYSYVVSTAAFERHADLFVKLRTGRPDGLLPKITFDDGHISNFEFALPILQSRNLTAHFFITVGWTGQRKGYMGWSELQALHQAGQLIGAHGWTHTLLTHCDETQLIKELNTARLTLEDRLGAPITTMSLPGGRYNSRVLAACKDAGYTHIFTSIPKAEPDPPEQMIGRLNIRGDMSLEWIATLFQPQSNVLSSLGRQYQRKETAKKILGDRLYEKLWAVLNRKESDSDMGEDTSNEYSAHHQ